MWMLPLSLVLLASQDPRPALHPQFYGLIGVVKSISEDGTSLQLKQKGGSILVDLSDVADVQSINSLPLSRIKTGAQLHVLGVRRKSGYYLAAGIHRVEAVVSGTFQAPPLPKKLEEKKLRWISGAYNVDEGGMSLGGISLKLEKKTRVIGFSPSERSAITKKMKIYVQGKLIGSKSDPRIQPRKIYILSTKVPSRYYRLVLKLGPLAL